jgi:hypothetical protein
MSGILGIGGGGDTEFYPYTLDQSVRFNDDDTAMLSRTFASAGNRRTWTWSGWVKRGNIGNTHPLFVAGSSGTSILQFAIQTSTIADRLALYNYTGSYNLNFATTQLFRDVGGWYHIVLKMDTTQATEADRVKIYVNGDEVTSFSTSNYPSQNFETLVNSAASHRIGRNFDTAVSNKSLDGYVAEVNFVDSPIFTAATTSGSATVTGISSTATLEVGMAVSSSTTSVIPDGTTIASIDSSSQITLSANATATNGSAPLTFSATIDFFGETKNGIWVPKQYTGSYGTNGFYLNFKDDIVSEGFNTVTYQGKGATQSISGLGFSPDLVWIKRRSASAAHALWDSVRGTQKWLLSNGTNAEISTSDGLSSFDGDGFTLGADATYGSWNNSGTHVAWAWDAGTGSAASNGNGTITSTVKANTDYGFSIVSYTGNGTDGATVGHGLSGVDFLIIKDRDNVRSWMVHSSASGFTDTDYLYLDTTDYKGRYGATSFLNGAPSSTVINLGDHVATNGSTTNYIAYCFEEISGYSKIDSYTGNGSSGHAITTGFEPAWLMVRRTDTANSWYIVDNTRTVNTAAGNDDLLYANLPNEEGSTNDFFTFTSTGFELNTSSAAVNTSGGTYIYMAFADTRDYAFWKDQSGNGNHFQPENLDYRDTLKDTPTNNYPTINGIQSHGSILSEGNLTMDNNNRVVPMLATMGVSSGKWAWKVTINTQDAWGIGISTAPRADDNSGGLGYVNYEYSYDTWSGNKRNNNTASAYGVSISSGGYVEVLLDLDAGTLVFKANGSDQGTAYTGLSGTFFPAFANWAASTGSGDTIDVDFGQGGYTAPSGYELLNTANLPAPGIDPAAGQAPDDYFNTVLYSGTGSTQSITGVGFAPDWVWLKQRNTARDHVLGDTVRGDNKSIYTNDPKAEESLSTISNFSTDGFDVGTTNITNASGGTFVAWNWKAGGTAVSNGDGTITSSVSASPESGFSILTYSGNGTAGATIGHGLGKAPDMIIIKRRNETRNWQVYHSSNTSAPETDKLTLNLTDATVDDNTSWNDTAPSASVFTVGTSNGTNNSSGTYVAYCFHSVDGFSKVGSYTGNGSTDGTFVHCGFRPAWIMVKRTDSASNWTMYDNKRLGYNVDNEQLYPNLSDAEGTSTHLDILSNGFKWRTSDGSRNASGGTYIYLAFAEQPFKYANAR